MLDSKSVPVKVLHDELHALLSEATLLGRDPRLERAFMIYRLGLIEDLAYRDLNREICRKFPSDEPVIPADAETVETDLPGNRYSGVLSDSELILISEQLSVRMDQLRYMADKYVQRSGYEAFADRHRKELASVMAVHNKIVRLINYVKSEGNKNES